MELVAARVCKDLQGSGLLPHAYRAWILSDDVSSARTTAMNHMVARGVHRCAVCLVFGNRRRKDTRRFSNKHYGILKVDPSG